MVVSEHNNDGVLPEVVPASNTLEPVQSGETVFVEFDGGRIAVVMVNGEPRPVLRWANDALGLNWQTQHRRLVSDPSICVAQVTTHLPGDDRTRSVTVTDLDGFLLWLAKINPNKVAPDARDRVIEWQRKAGRALRERFFPTAPAPGTALSAVPDLSGLDPAGLAWLGQIGQALTTTTAHLAAAKHELERSRTKVEYVDTYVTADKDSALLRVFANQQKIGEEALRRFLLERKVIYDAPFQRFSKKKQKVVTESSYHAYAQYKAWFTERDQPKAPRRPDGRLRTTLDITAVGKVAVARLLRDHPLETTG